MGLLQATEVVKLILGIGEPAIGRLLLYDALGRDADRGQGPPRPRVPDLLARPRGDHRRGDGRVPGLRGVLRRGRVGCQRRVGSVSYGRRRAADCCHADMATIKIPPVLRASVGGEKRGRAPPARTSATCCATSPRSHPATAEPAVLRRGRAQPLRQRLPQRRGRARARRAGHGRRRRRDTLVILPAMAGGR